ncbi:MAG: tRNA(Met) cytidine acetyltransferase, partial [Myxococcales bacterium]|nr:tRNA(Met) cytidine acetyltransferase [Myxococcales bacterium]
MQHPPLARILDALHGAGAATRHRRLLVLEGSAEALAELAPILVSPGAPWIGHRAPPGVDPLPPDRAGELLGTELHRAVLDCTAGFWPDALAAVAGAVVAGGVLVVAVPHGWGQGDPLAARCRRLWTDAPGVRWVQLAEPWPHVAAAAPSPGPVTPAADGPWRTADQGRAVAAVERLIRGRKRRPLVLTADRGRGKSAALGLAVGRLLGESPLQVVITGPSAAAVAPALTHAAAVLGVAVRHHRVKAPNGGALWFMPPGELWADPPAAQLVLVDEAATLPVPLLTGLLDRHPRIGFATTVHGYEGTGQGFALRFRDALDARTPGWRALSLSEPIRFAADDPVEAAVGRALCLDARAVTAETARQAAQAPLEVAWPTPAALAADEAILTAAFGLLVDAHYRTTPADLQRLLTDPTHRVAVLQAAGVVLGAAVVVDEGGLVERARVIAAGAGRARG